MKQKLRRQWEQGKQEIVGRLAPFMGGTEPRQEGRPEFSGPQPTYELADRTRAMPYGGIGAIHQLVREAERALRGPNVD